MDLSALRASVRFKADEEGTDFVDNTELDRVINQACRWVYNQLVSKYTSRFIREGTTGNTGKFSTVSGTQGYSLPTDTKDVVTVEMRDSSSTDDDDYRKLRRLNIGAHEREDYWPIREGTHPTFGYFLAGSKIYLKPVPDAVYTIRLWDIPRFTALSATSDTPGFDEEYHELASELAALQLLGTSGEDIFRERFQLFEVEKLGLDVSSPNRDYQSETMIITNDSDWSR
jgi:hypothetical protein